MVYGGSNIGLYMSAGDSFLLVPSGTGTLKAQAPADMLQVPWRAVSVCGTRLPGAMCARNGETIVVPDTIHQSEYDTIQEMTEIHVIEARHTALGNLVCANRRGAIVSPLFDAHERRSLQEALGVEVVSMGVAGMMQTGSVMATNDTGTVVHPMADEDEIRDITAVLHTRVEPSTINNGIPYVSSGLLVNNHHVMVGDLTTGPEIMMLTRAFLG